MKFKIQKSEMLLGLQRVQNIVERKTTMPILSNALLEAQADVLSLSATDLEVGIQSLLIAKVESVGAVTVRARALHELVRELPDGEICFNLADNSKLELSTKFARFNLPTLPAEDFPEIPTLASCHDQVFVEMNGKLVMAMLDKTLYATSTDETRYHLNGVFIESFDDAGRQTFRMVATDSHRLALVDNNEAVFENSATALFRNGLILPKKGLYELRKLLSEGKDTFAISVRSGAILVKKPTIFLSMRLIEGKYADYRRLVPGPYNQAIILDKDLFLASLKRVSLMASDKSRSVTFSLSPGTLQLSSQSPELGDAKETIDVGYTGEQISIGFNSKYLIDAVSTVDGEKFLLEIRAKHSSGVIRAVDGANHTAVVMPMRI